MMDTRIDLGFQPIGAAASDDDFDAFLTAVQDHLLDIDRGDIDVTGSLANRTASFIVFDVDPASPHADRFWSDVRTALHAVGCSTKGWDANQAAWRAVSQELAFCGHQASEQARLKGLEPPTF